MPTPPERLRALLAKPGFVVMPAVWDGLSAKLAAQAGFPTAFLSGSCVAAGRLGGPDLDLTSFAEMMDSFQQVRGAASDMLVLADGDHGFGTVFGHEPRHTLHKQCDIARRAAHHERMVRHCLRHLVGSGACCGGGNRAKCPRQTD